MMIHGILIVIVLFCSIPPSLNAQKPDTVSIDTLSKQNNKLDKVSSLPAKIKEKGFESRSKIKLDKDELISSPSPNWMNELQGKIPGMYIRSNDGSPGSPMDIRIRGTNSFRLSNDPLWVIDGIPMEQINSANDLTQMINPRDIKSIKVLKGAEATIYGSRGANGVIVIETK